MSEGFVKQARAKLEKELLDIENRDDLTDDQKVSQIVVIFSTVCAGIAVQPIPFADIFILTPLQAYMGARISAIRWKPLGEQETTDIIKEIMGVVGLGLVAQQMVIAAAKILFPIFGGVVTIPVVFSLTYAIGKVLDAYFIARANDKELSKSEIKNIWKKAKKDSQAEAEKQKSEISKHAKH